MATLQTQPASDQLLLNTDQKAIIDQILEENKDKSGAVMVVLNELQSQIGFVSEAMQSYVAQAMQIPVSTIHGVVSFYSFFHNISPWAPHDQILYGHCMLRWRYAPING